MPACQAVRICEALQSVCKTLILSCIKLLSTVTVQTIYCASYCHIIAVLSLMFCAKALSSLPHCSSYCNCDIFCVGRVRGSPCLSFTSFRADWMHWLGFSLATNIDVEWEMTSRPSKVHLAGKHASSRATKTCLDPMTLFFEARTLVKGIPLDPTVVVEHKATGWKRA